MPYPSFFSKLSHKGYSPKSSFYNENAYEQCLLELFRDTLSWDYRYGPDVERDVRNALYQSILEELI